MTGLPNIYHIFLSATIHMFLDTLKKCQQVVRNFCGMAPGSEVQFSVSRTVCSTDALALLPSLPVF